MLAPTQTHAGDPHGSEGILSTLRAQSRSQRLGARPAILLPLVWLFLDYLGDSSPSSIVSGIDLIMHEGGHLFFMWFGNDLLTVGGGTLFQILIPVGIGVMFFRNGDPLAVAVAVFWVGLNLAEIAPYAADARSQLLPLVSPFPGAPVHDWTYLLGRAGLLQQDQLVGKAFRHAGIATMAGALVLSGWVLNEMRTGRHDRQE